MDQVSLRPARTQETGASKDASVAIDLDDLAVNEQVIILFGERHTIRQMTLVEMVQSSKLFRGIDEANRAIGHLNDDAIAEKQYDAYTQLFQSVVPTLKREHVEKMKVSQVKTLFLFLFQQVTGKQLDFSGPDPKKKVSQ